MSLWEKAQIGDEIELAYGRSLPMQKREIGPYRVFGSNGCVGYHSVALVFGPGIIVGRKGSVGSVVWSKDDFWPIDTTYYVVNKKDHNWRFLFHLLSSIGLSDMNSHSAVPGLNRENVYSIQLQLPKKDEQESIASVLDTLENAIVSERSAIEKTIRLKGAMMHLVFTHGLRGETQKETKIGPMPESWRMGCLGQFANVISTRMAYTELQRSQQPVGENAVKVLGVKVADMNLPGNEVKLQTAVLEKMLDKATAEYRCAPPRTIIFPKRGAAIATNKKRMSTEWTAFDPNVIGIVAGNELDQDFLFQWLQMFDLRTITDDGPTPQLNKKNLLPLSIPIPPTLIEQREIVAILDGIDRKIDLHRKKRAVLDELFKVLLHKLMTGEIQVSELAPSTATYLPR